MNPVSGFFDNIKHNRFLLTVQQNLIDFFDDMINIISCDSSNRFNFILKRSDGVLFSKLKHDVDLVL